MSKKNTDLFSEESTNDEIEKLAEQVRYHNKKYFDDAAPEISDIAFDELYEKLRALDPNHPALTELVDSSKEDFKKVAHEIPMLSIEKVFTVEDVIKWAEDAGAFKSQQPEDGLVASFKVDGSACSLIYEDGKLLRAVSRGNGILGDDITRNVQTIADVPQTIPALKGTRVDIRGEVYMTWEIYNTVFKAALKTFEHELAAGLMKEEDINKGPRNYCAGSLKQKIPAITRSRQLSFIAHGCFGKLPGGDGKSDFANQKILESLGFKIAVFKHVQQATDVQAAITDIEAQKPNLPYKCDGVVFTINKMALHDELESTSHHPRYKMAFKFGRDRGETTLKNILWETSRSGKVAPVMEVEPIILDHAEVRRCTLHNAKTVKEAGLNIGDKVLLEREVIPYFVQRIPPAESPSDKMLPKQCGSCGCELSWDETQTNLVCTNIGGCIAQLVDYLSYYTSRGVTNMMGVGEEILKKMVGSGLIKSPADLYTLTEQQLLEKLERQGETSARNIIASIQSRREQPLEMFLISLGVRSLGRSVSARLMSQFHTLENILKASETDLLAVENFAETMARNICTGLKARRPLIDELLQHITITMAEKIEGSLTGKSFCLTGHIEFDYAGKHYDARPDIEDLIKSKGGVIKSVSKALNFLVVGDEAGSKVEKAQKAGVTILDGAGLLKMLG